jgi:hypothetical protein
VFSTCRKQEAHLIDDDNVIQPYSRSSLLGCCSQTLSSDVLKRLSSQQQPFPPRGHVAKMVGTSV